MCNPRRLAIRLTREVSQSWSEEITRVAHGTARVGGEASAVLQLTQDLGDDLNAAFLRAIGRDERWIAAGDDYELDVADGTARFVPSTGELRVHASITDDVNAEVQIIREIFDEQREEISALGQGRGETLAEARNRASQNATSRLDVAEAAVYDRLLEQARRSVQQQLESAAAELDQDLAVALAEALRTRAEARRAELQAATEARLEAVREAAMASITENILTGLRSTVAAFAAEHSGSVTRDQVSDGYLEIQLEWEG